MLTRLCVESAERREVVVALRVTSAKMLHQPPLGEPDRRVGRAPPEVVGIRLRGVRQHVVDQKLPEVVGQPRRRLLAAGLVEGVDGHRQPRQRLRPLAERESALRVAMGGDIILTLS